MSDKKEAKWTLQEILGVCIFSYMVIAVFFLIAFTTLEGGPNDGEAIATGFLKAAIWPYSVIEWNIKN